MQFLTFLVNTIKAVHDNSEILRASIAVAGNEHRLGAHEAPPAIISVFIGSQLTDMLNQLEERVTNKKMTPDEKTELKLDIGKIPEILLDNTDRNRTSPFAFTGNRFEFRAVGASANVASPMIALNTAVATQLKQFRMDVDALVEKDIKKDEAIFDDIVILAPFDGLKLKGTSAMGRINLNICLELIDPNDRRLFYPMEERIRKIVEGQMQELTWLELRTPEGKIRLKYELLQRINGVFNKPMIRNLYFTNFMMR